MNSTTFLSNTLILTLALFLYFKIGNSLSFIFNISSEVFVKPNVPSNDQETNVPLFSKITKYEILKSPKENYDDIDIVFGIKTNFAGEYKGDAIRQSFGNNALYQEGSFLK